MDLGMDWKWLKQVGRWSRNAYNYLAVLYLTYVSDVSHIISSIENSDDYFNEFHCMSILKTLRWPEIDLATWQMFAPCDLHFTCTDACFGNLSHATLSKAVSHEHQQAIGVWKHNFLPELSQVPHFHTKSQCVLPIPPKSSATRQPSINDSNSSMWFHTDNLHLKEPWPMFHIGTCKQSLFPFPPLAFLGSCWSFETPCVLGCIWEMNKHGHDPQFQT